jgi:hypothetical protein
MKPRIVGVPLSLFPPQTITNQRYYHNLIDTKRMHRDMGASIMSKHGDTYSYLHDHTAEQLCDRLEVGDDRDGLTSTKSRMKY